MKLVIISALVLVTLSTLCSLSLVGRLGNYYYKECDFLRTSDSSESDFSDTFDYKSDTDIDTSTEMSTETSTDNDLDLEYKGHPYKNVNLNRDLTPVNIFKQGILGKKREYMIQKALGSGTFGSVYKAVHMPTGDQVALKMMVHSKEELISKEVLILKELKDAPNFLGIRDVLREKHEDGSPVFGLVLDFFKAKKFEEFYEKMDAYQVKVLIFQVMRTLEYAHSKGIMHRDIKPLNVLMDPESLQVRVIDWGQAEYYVPDTDFSIHVSTTVYKGPEMLLGYPKYDYTFDVWNTGVMLMEMAFKQYHFFHPDRKMFPKDPKLNKKENKVISKRGQLDAYARVFGTKDLKAYTEKFKDDMDLDILNYVGDYEGVPLTSFINDANAHIVEPLLIDLVSKMLVYDHTKRITMKEALAHPYFDEIRNEYTD